MILFITKLIYNNIIKVNINYLFYIFNYKYYFKLKFLKK